MDLSNYSKFDPEESATEEIRGIEIQAVLDEIAYFNTWSEYVNLDDESVYLFLEYNSLFTPTESDKNDIIQQLGMIDIDCSVVEATNQGLYIEPGFERQIISVHKGNYY